MIKILVVDDEPDIVELLQYNLEKEGYEVYTAYNGLEAIEVAKKRKPDLIMLDIMMPELDGVEVCRQLRTNKDFDQTLIVFLSARGEDFTQIAALDVGGDDFISKPVSPRVLISRIKALTRRSGRSSTSNAEAAILIAGDLVINKEDFTVSLNGNIIEFAKKEFEILHLLASKPGKVFTREEIFNKIWGQDVIVGNRTIDVHIRKVREKIGDKLIKTVKGIGYKLEF